MAINGKKKGNRNERNLTKWWNKWTGWEFSRVPQSGGLRWHNKEDITGDIICTEERKSRRFAFSIEAKSYKDINFEHLLLSNKKIKILDFWKQAKEDAIRAKKIPILFMRYNGMPKETWFVILREQDVKTHLAPATKHFLVKLESEKFIILNSNDLLSLDFHSLHKALKIKNRKILNR